MTGDLFAPARQPTGPHTGRDHPETSREAARKVEPSLATIREGVLTFARLRGEGGFLDDDLAARFGSDSYRKRRTELADEGLVVDSLRRRQNRDGNSCVVWVHRDHAPGPTATARRSSRQSASPELKAEGAAMAQELARYAETQRLEGRLFHARLAEAARIMRELSR